ncbi:ficolin-1-like [Pocillopora damicornis]|uniref:ficolin-1-like n=1 Tax=Pocillopora damicornis TaxID=46731 RepID=UPI000F54C803|nr:ficolin-1-like [Pocillopora damicornis]
MLRFDQEDFEGNITYAEYTTFKVADEADKYRLLIEGYSGTAGDSMVGHHRMQFSTKNSKNDKSSDTHFASKFNGAWWYNNCHDSNLNGIYYGGPSDSFADGVCWTQFKGLYYSLKRTEMKLRLRIMKK